jgi:hypothetical protein
MTEPAYPPESAATEVVVHAKPKGVWTRALDFVSGPAHIKITMETSEQWSTGTAMCGAAGLYEVSADAFLATAPVGSLIAKIGGSDADCPPPPATTGIAQPFKIHAVGNHGVIRLAADESGPLFLTMNDTLANFRKHLGQLTVKIRIAIG